MKRYLLSVLVAVLSLAASAYEVKDGAVVFSSVVEGTGSVEQAHAALESFFALRYNDVNSTLKLNQPDRLLYKGLFVELGRFAMGMWTIDAPYSIEVNIKDGRVRVMVSVSDAVYRSTGSSPVRYSYSVPGSAPITAKCSNPSVSKKDCAAAFVEIERRAEALLADVAAALKSPADEDW